MPKNGRVKNSDLNNDQPFDCCGHHDVCNMGRKKCVYEQHDIKYALLCRVYLRGLKNKEEQPKIEKEQINDSSFDIMFDEYGQGSLL